MWRTWPLCLEAFVLSDCFCQCWARNLMRLLLLLGDDKRRLHCFILWPATILLKRRPVSDPRFTLSAFFMDSSRYTLNTTSTRELCTPERNADTNSTSESSAKVLLSPWTFWTRLTPSMMQVDSWGMVSTNDTFFSSCRARVALLVFFRVPSQLPSDHGNGPSGWVRTDLMSNYKDHVTKQLVICFENCLLVGTFSQPWFVDVGKGFQFLFGKWIVDRLLFVFNSIFLEMLVCFTLQF